MEALNDEPLINLICDKRLIFYKFSVFLKKAYTFFNFLFILYYNKGSN